MLAARELELLAKEMRDVVRIMMAKEIEPLKAEIATLQGQLAESESKRVDAEEVARLVVVDLEPGIHNRIDKQIANIPVPRDGVDGRDGKDGTNGKDATHADIVKALGEHLAANPIREPKDGRDGRDGINGKDGTNGKSADPITPDDIEHAVSVYMQKHPVVDGRDGKDGENGRDGIDGKHGLDGVDGKDATPGKDGSDGRDGKDGKSVTFDDVWPRLREECLKHMPVATELMPQLESMFSKWALDSERRFHELVQKTLDAIEKPKDGKDGRDGIDFTNWDIKLSEDFRTLTLSLQRGEDIVERSVAFPCPLHRGIWDEQADYAAGDMVTRDGSIWLAVADHRGDKPGFTKSWRLVVKRGSKS